MMAQYKIPCRFNKLYSMLYFSVLLFFLFCTISNAQEWQELKGEHFLVYFTQENKFIQEVLDKAELYYGSIASDLGYPRYSQFWLWDKRVKIYIYPNHSSFLKATGHPQWSHGVADYTNKKIESYSFSREFLDSILPHEITHLIFRDFVGFKGEIPLWLDEGVAQWAEVKKRKEYKATIKRFYQKDALISLEDMMKLDIRSIKTEDKEGLISKYYLQSVSLIGFLIEKYGSNRFADFCRELRDGKKLEEALRSAYPTYIHNLNELEDMWKEYLYVGGIK